MKQVKLMKTPLAVIRSMKDSDPQETEAEMRKYIRSQIKFHRELMAATGDRVPVEAWIALKLGSGCTLKQAAQAIAWAKQKEPKGEEKKV